MTTRTTSLTLAMLLIFAAPILAQNAVSDSAAIPEPLKDFYYAGLAPERLAYAVDCWHDAVLKADGARISATERELLSLLQHDLDSTTQVLEQFRQLLWQAQVASTVMPDTGASLSDDLPVLERIDQEYYSYAFNIQQTKEKLVTAIRRSDAFSNKYRLISDYIEVLRRQVGLPKLKLAGSRVLGDKVKTTVPTDVRVTEGVIGTPLDN